MNNNNNNDHFMQDPIEDTANFDCLSDKISMRGSELNLGMG